MGASHRVLVCGLGASGRAAIRLLRSKGIDILAVDENDGPEVREGAEWARSLGCEVGLGGTIPLTGWFDAAILSPGIPLDAPYLAGVRRRRIPLVPELELGWGHAGLATVAVTGSNGKSSVVKALAAGFQAAGQRAVPCGNYGVPVCDAAMEPAGAGWLVIEASSFQLESCTKLHPEVAVLLNVLPNHLDRHGDFEAYAHIKARIFARQRRGDAALVPPEWLERMRAWSGGRGDWKTFGTGPDVEYAYAPGRIREKSGEEIDIAGSYFDNEVLGPNAAALYGAARAAGIPPEAIRAALAGFEPLPHRARIIAERDGVRYVDDSKATNLSAMAASIRMQDRPVRLIAGGRPKETDFAAALPVLRERVREVFLIGEAAGAMASAWRDAAPCTVCGTLGPAVEAARRAARPGETVLLAPACTSYDQFRSFAERGEAFRKFVVE
jgi:UDP-N-acetylmuramoylalanine--D-glutamate ligase